MAALLLVETLWIGRPADDMLPAQVFASQPQFVEGRWVGEVVRGELELSDLKNFDIDLPAGVCWLFSLDGRKHTLFACGCELGGASAKRCPLCAGG